jgi:hypothetical protein
LRGGGGVVEENMPFHLKTCNAEIKISGTGNGEGVVEFLFQCGAGLGDLGEEFFVFRQEVVHVTGAGVGVVGVFEVEVEVARFDLVDGDTPSLLVFLTFAVVAGFVRLSPPLFLRLELLDADGFALVVALGTGRIGMLVIPDFFRGRAFGEEEEVGADAGVGIEDAVGQADDRVQVAVGEGALP